MKSLALAVIALALWIITPTPASAIPVCEAHQNPPTFNESQNIACQADKAGNVRVLAPVQQATTSNQTQTSSTNAINTITLAAPTSVSWTVRSIIVSVAGTTIVCALTVKDGATTILNVDVGGLTATAPFVLPIEPLTATSGNAVAIAVSACGTGNTSKLSVIADHP